ncbi:hypothetical protein EVAR_100363_1 [Eumeta japonica]|uniref:Uncharacterized protein n=1 Tax=Eumeta variegata TaxID=151549 RepID=A0A4C2A613_EUMVA|nr:hypothetical protein EVAR_100363_1 [Eumeta japonica]
MDMPSIRSVGARYTLPLTKIAADFWEEKLSSFLFPQATTSTSNAPPLFSISALDWPSTTAVIINILRKNFVLDFGIIDRKKKRHHILSQEKKQKAKKRTDAIRRPERQVSMRFTTTRTRALATAVKT